MKPETLDHIQDALSETLDKVAVLKRAVRDDWDGQPHPTGIPYPLWKATWDPYFYSLGLRDGMQFHFESAHIDGEWARLDGIRQIRGLAVDLERERGVYIRIADIAWIADSGH